MFQTLDDPRPPSLDPDLRERVLTEAQRRRVRRRVTAAASSAGLAVILIAVAIAMTSHPRGVPVASRAPGSTSSTSPSETSSTTPGSAAPGATVGPENGANPSGSSTKKGAPAGKGGAAQGGAASTCTPGDKANSPLAVATGFDGSLWLALTGNRIGHMTMQGQLTAWPIPSSETWVWAINPGPDGAMWFTQTGRIGRIHPDGTITMYPLPRADDVPRGITTGPDGAVWFAEGHRHQIGRITTAGAVSYYPAVDAATPDYANPVGIASGPDAALWFTGARNRIGRMALDGTVSWYDYSGVSAGGFHPADGQPARHIISGRDGALWFTVSAGLLRMTTDGSPMWIAGGHETQDTHLGFDYLVQHPDGSFWVTADDDSKVVRVGPEPTHPETDYRVDNLRGFGGIAVGGDGAVWAPEAGVGAFFDRVTPDGHVSRVPMPCPT